MPAVPFPNSNDSEDSRTTPDATVGRLRRVGPYEIRERIGQGGMATVYRAWHTGLHRYEALKIPRRDAGADTEFIQRLLCEARIAARLRHPHIVAIHGSSEDTDSLPYLAMDLVEGQDLAQLLEAQGAMPLSDAVEVLKQTASALSYAHEQGVVHRDVKPENILLERREGRWFAKVVDFGISRAGEDPGGTRLTRSGMLVGTPEYMSPEQSGSGEAVDYRTDIYSLAVLAYEMLTGTPPFTVGDGVSKMAILISHVRDTPRPPHELRSEIAPEATDVILKALEKNPADRYESCTAFIAALEAVLHSTPVVLPARRSELAETLPAASPPRSRHIWRAVPAVGVAALIGVFVGWLASTTFDKSIVAPVASPIGNQISPTAAKTVLPGKASATEAASTAAPGGAITKRRQARRTPIAFAKKTRPTATLLSGQRKIVQAGKPGLRETILELTFRNGREVARRAVATKTLIAPLPQIELSGTLIRNIDNVPLPRPSSAGDEKSLRPRRSSTQRRTVKTRSSSSASASASSASKRRRRVSPVKRANAPRQRATAPRKRSVAPRPAVRRSREAPLPP